MEGEKLLNKKFMLISVFVIFLIAMSVVSANEITTNSTDEVVINDNLALKAVKEDTISDVYNNSDENGELDDYYPGFEYSNMYNNAYVNLTLPEDAKGNLVVSLYDYDEDLNLITTEIGNVNVIDGKASVKLPCMELTEYEFGAEYTGSDYSVDPLDEYVQIIPKFDVPSIAWVNDDVYISFEMPEGEMLKLFAYQTDNLFYRTTIKNGSKIKLNNLTCGYSYYYLTFENMDETYSADYNFGLDVRPDNPEFELNVTVDDIIIGEDINYVNIELPRDHYYFEDMITVIIDGDKSNLIKTDTNHFYLNVKNLTPGIHTVDVTCEADDYYKKATASTTFNVSYIAINVDKIYEYNGMIYVDLIDNASGYLVLYVDENLQDVTFANKKPCYLSLSNITTGNHKYEIKYSGDDNYAPYSKTGKFNIDYEFTLNSITDMDYGENNQIEVLINDYATGNVILSLDGKNYTEKINNGTAIFDLPKLTSGKYPITVTYLGDNNLDPKTIHEELEFSNGIQIENNHVNLTLPENAKGNLIVKLYDKNEEILFDEYDVKLVNGKASVSFANLDIGEYYVMAEYTGEDYSLSQTSAPIFIEKYYDDIKVNVPETLILNQDANMAIALPDKYDKSLLNVKIIGYGVDGAKIILYESNGKTNIKLPTSKLGNYGVEITYDGNNLEDQYFNVIPLKLNIPRPYSDVKLGKVISVEMPKDAKGKINWYFYKFSLGGKLTNTIVSDESVDGKLSIVLENLTTNNYATLFQYCDEVYGNYTTYLRINVIGEESEYNIDALNNENSTVFNINLNNDAEGELILIVNNELYGSKLDNGVATISVPKLNAENIVTTVYYSGDKKYNPFKKTNDVFIKLKSLIVVSAVTTVYNGGKYLTATLKDSNGKKISGVKLTVVLGGKTYTPTTDKNGQVKVSTNGLAPVKTYVAKITFNGNSKYDKSTKSVKINVKKANPKLTAAKKTFKRTVNVKNYAVILKTNKNKAIKSVWVSLKVNKKTYKVKTRANGQAIFKINNLAKKGTFNAVVKFAGNKYYNAKTVNTKIFVR